MSDADIVKDIRIRVEALGATSTQKEIDALQEELDNARRTVKDFEKEFERLQGTIDSVNKSVQRAGGAWQSFRNVQKDFGGQQATNLNILKNMNDTLGKGFVVASSDATQRSAMFAASMEEASSATTGMASGSLPRLRYALYDVSTTLAIAGAGMVALSAATLGTAISMDRQFADVVRTTGTFIDETGKQTANLRHEFDDLFASLPTSWSDLTDIGTLAGQLGIAADATAEFTSLVAKFAAVTDVSVEQSATAFGRLSELLNVPASEFENLGSSILAVGVDSVATEGQIVAISSQIASMGSFAGMSAEEVVGLSAAMASLGVQPELSRGVITRLFTNITNAVAEGGDQLEVFGRLTDKTGAQFASLWGSDATQALELFLTGLGEVEDSKAVSVLNELGITASRDIPTLLKLAQNSQLVSDSIAVATKGYEDGTAIQDQYGVIAETVASKLQVLGNNLQLLVANLGGASSTFGPIIDGITTFVQGLNSLVDVPVVQQIALFVVGATALAGVLALVTGGAARAAGSFLAIRQAVFEASVAMGSMESVTAATEAGFTKAAFSIKGFRAALISTGIGAALAAIGTALAYFVGQSEQAAFSNEELARSFDSVTGAITQNTRDLAFNALVESGAVEAAKALGIDLGVLTDAWLGNSSAIATVGEATAAAGRAVRDALAANGALDSATIKTWDSIHLLNDTIVEGNAATDEARQYALDHAQALRETDGAAQDTSVSFDDLEESVTNFADGLFDIINAEMGVIGATYDLGAAMANNGTSFDQFSVGGRANIEALQKAISAASEAAGGDASLFSAYVQQIVNDLVAAGAVGVQQLDFVRSALGAGRVSQITADLANARLSGQVAQGYNDVAKSAKNMGGSAGKAAKEVRTLSDYVRDLSTVFSDAFEFRFGFGQSQDATSDAIQSILDGFADAQQKVRDVRLEIQGLQADISGLRADQGTLNYQLGVAIEYGDTLRAAQIRAELEKVSADLASKEADLADTQKELTKAQQASTPTLEGNTEAARDQREAVLDLLKSYEDQIVAYANTGASQDQVRRYAEQLRGEFENQMRQLGYNQAEVAKYSAGLSDVITIINKIPRNLTLSANTDPAQRALDEFFAKNQNKTITTTQNVVRNETGPSAYDTRRYALQDLLNYYRDMLRDYYNTHDNINGYSTALEKNIRDLMAKLASGQFYGGGYTGSGGMYEPAGTVHRGEYVIPKRDVNQRTGLPYADALDRLRRGTPGRVGYAQGGYVQPSQMIVELGPKSLRAVQEGGQVILQVDGRTLASTVNKANASVTGTMGLG